MDGGLHKHLLRLLTVDNQRYDTSRNKRYFLRKAAGLRSTYV